MERIDLTPEAKIVLRELDQHNSHAKVMEALGSAEEHHIKYAFRVLHRYGLIKCSFATGGKPVDSGITDFGKAYLRKYPDMENPLDIFVIESVQLELSEAQLELSKVQLENERLKHRLRGFQILSGVLAIVSAILTIISLCLAF